MDIQAFKHSGWTKIWAGTWSFLSCSHFGVEYTKLIRFGERPFLSQAIIFVSEGKSNCWATQTDRDILGTYLAGQISNNPERAREVCTSLKQEVDEILTLLKVLIKKNIDLQTYQQFLRQVVKYYYWHIYDKYVVDYLEPEMLEKCLPYFEEARIYAESVFKRTEEFTIAMAEQIARQTGVAARLIVCLTYTEMEEYLVSKQLPEVNILEAREKSSAFIFDQTESQVFVGEAVKEIEKLVFGNRGQNSIKGQTAFAGKAVGTVRIILDPAKADNFKAGDILVAGMTRPDYLSLMKQASAFVTDGGGILCHAAIVAREMKKPCVIGTQIATKVLRDGDMVEVDAEKGLVRIIK